MKLLLAFAVLIAVVAADVSELSNDYLPPLQSGVAPSQDYLPPVVGGSASSIGGGFVEPAHELGPDGYRYKTVRKLRYRHRRF